MPTLIRVLALAAALMLAMYAWIAWLEPDGPEPVMETRLFGE